MKAIRFFFVLAFVSSILALVSSFCYTIPDLAPAHLKPCNNFDWLKEFYVLNTAVTPEHWEKNPGIGFDSTGIVTVNKNYNAVTTSQYALVCFDNYKKTGDKSFLKKFITQVEYLKSPAAYKLISEDCIGYPYLYTFHDLKPPWYSGLAQAEVISVLIRYYSITKDEEVLPLIIKARNFLLLPIEEKGLLSKTEENNIWIEEYPHSKQHLHVLNGFFIITIGLNEYCNLFKEDKYAYKVYLECIESIKKSTKFYELPNNWLAYDRGNKSAVPSWYMKAQTLEMEHLYRMTGDYYFKKQGVLWGTYCYQKNLDLPGCNINTTNFSVPATEVDGWLVAGSKYVNLITRSNISLDTVIGFTQAYKKFCLFDDNKRTYFSSSVEPVMKNESILVEFKKPIEAEGLSLEFIKDSSSITVDYLEIKLADKNNWKKIRSNNTSGDKSYVEYSFEKLSTIRSFRLVFKAGKHESKRINLEKVNLFKSIRSDTLSSYIHSKSNVIKVERGSLDVTFDKKSIDEYYIFYKSSKDSLLNKTTWTALNSISSPQTKIVLEDGHCFAQFLTVFKIKNASSSITPPQFISRE